MVEGGLANTAARLAIRWAIRASVTPRTTLVVQNPDERDDLVRSGRVRRRTVVVEGAGVDCAAFAPRPEPPGPVAVVLPARLLKSKGVLDFVAAARILRARGSRARFLLAGDADEGNAYTVARRDLRAWTEEGVVEWLGHCDDMPARVAASHIVCLPSHGEGLPKALTEAAASGRAIVATDVPGCREVVEHDRNGLLVPPRDPAALAAALERLILDPEARARFGAAGRSIALARFDERIIIPRMLEIYRDLHPPHA